MLAYALCQLTEVAMLQVMHVDSTTGRDWINALAADPLTLRWLLRGLAGSDFADITQHPHMLEAVFHAGCLIRRERITTEKQVRPFQSSCMAYGMLEELAVSILPIISFKLCTRPGAALGKGAMLLKSWCTF